MLNRAQVAAVPYPPLPQEAAAGELRLRPFGACLEDLQLDLGSPDWPGAITDVLAACTMPALDADFFWDLPVSKRTECLLVLAALDGATEADADFRCGVCRQPLEISLSVDELLAAGAASGNPPVLLDANGATTELRLPTGRDQAAWATQEYATERAFREAIVSRLTGHAVDWDEDALARIEGALDEADPLLRTAVEASCPDCGSTSEHEVDVTGSVLARLRRAQEALIRTVHLLASRYHWSEAEIFAVPAWRRAQYVTMLESEGIA